VPIHLGGPLFGPWRPDIDHHERIARLRALRAFALVFARGQSHFIEALAAAETGDDPRPSSGSIASPHCRGASCSPAITTCCASTRRSRVRGRDHGRGRQSRLSPCLCLRPARSWPMRPGRSQWSSTVSPHAPTIGGLAGVPIAPRHLAEGRPLDRARKLPPGPIHAAGNLRDLLRGNAALPGGV
jgi:hypothetical protein